MLFLNIKASFSFKSFFLFKWPLRSVAYSPFALYLLLSLPLSSSTTSYFTINLTQFIQVYSWCYFYRLTQLIFWLIISNGLIICPNNEKIQPRLKPKNGFSGFRDSEERVEAEEEAKWFHFNVILQITRFSWIWLIN